MRKTFMMSAVAALLAVPVQAQDGEAAAEVAEDVLYPVEAAVEGAGFYPHSPRVRVGRPLLRAADYPAQAWRENQEGMVLYTVNVDAEGKPTGCEVTRSSGYPLLDEATCRVVMERGQFSAARDEDGNAVAGVYEGRYDWWKREPEFSESFLVTMAKTVGVDGEPRDCEIIEVSGTFPEDMQRRIERNPCRGLVLSGQVYRDENGNPVEKRVTVTFGVTVEDIDE